MARTTPSDWPCTDPDCICCGHWQEIACRSLSVAERLAHVASILAGKNTSSEEIIWTLQAAEAALAGENAAKDDTVCRLQATETALVEDNNRYKKANKDLNAKANGIRTKGLESVPAADPQQPGRRGRPPGQRATISRRPQKIHRTMLNDFCRCPECNKGDISDEVDRYSRVVEMEWTITENVEIWTVRRYCRDCKKLVSRDVPGAVPYTRVSANKSAAMVSLNMVGLPRQGRELLH